MQSVISNTIAFQDWSVMMDLSHGDLNNPMTFYSDQKTPLRESITKKPIKVIQIIQWLQEENSPKAHQFCLCLSAHGHILPIHGKPDKAKYEHPAYMSTDCLSLSLGESQITFYPYIDSALLLTRPLLPDQ